MRRVDPVDISEHVRAITDALELKYGRVLELTITPSDVTALVFLENENGKPHVDRVSGLAVLGRTSRKVKA
jgi:hypothetical protein